MKYRVVTATLGKAPVSIHRHEARLVVFLRGAMRERTFEGAARFEAADFVFRPHHFAHASEAQSREAAYTHVQVSPQLVRRWVGRYGWRCGRGRVALQDIGDAGSLLEAAIPDVFRASPPKGRMDRVADALRSAYPAPATRLAEEVGLAPHQLTRHFFRTYGMTPTCYRRQARLQRALGRLAEGSASLVSIAQDCGFHDQAHLCREVRRDTGLTPREIFVAHLA